ncbi:hypothetical protein AGMMS50256_28040 [Betaproteobacteria bacterium]|nr:hypothetical protein AGMMS50256_28040 [Betaproteobacteria bacterium]
MFTYVTGMLDLAIYDAIVYIPEDTHKDINIFPGNLVKQIEKYIDIDDYIKKYKKNKDLLFSYKLKYPDKSISLISFLSHSQWKNIESLDIIINGFKELISIVKTNNIKSIVLPSLTGNITEQHWNEILHELELMQFMLDDFKIYIYIL